jgi:hypothetical protein
MSRGESGPWIWARSHLTSWQHLVGKRGWVPRDYKERSIRSIKVEILTPDGASKTASPG